MQKYLIFILILFFGCNYKIMVPKGKILFKKEGYIVFDLSNRILFVPERATTSKDFMHKFNEKRSKKGLLVHRIKNQSVERYIRKDASEFQFTQFNSGIVSVLPVVAEYKFVTDMFRHEMIKRKYNSILHFDNEEAITIAYDKKVIDVYAMESLIKPSN